MAFLSMSPKTDPIPNAIMAVDDPDQLRSVALEMEDAARDDDSEFTLERPGLIFMSKVLHGLADRIERDG